MQQVELLEPVADRAAAVPPAPSRRPRTRALVVLLVAALALVGTQLVLGARDRAADARVAQLPGVLPLVGPDLRERWRVEAADVELLTQGAEVAGHLVGVRTRPDGAQSVVGLDPSTGALAWSTALTGPDPVLAVRGARASPTACRPVPAAASQVACLVSDVVLGIGVQGRLTLTRPPAESRVVLVDAGSGRVLADHGAPSALTFVVVGGLAVVARPGPDGHAEVAAQDLRTGTVVWRHRSPRPAVDPAGDVSGFALLSLGDDVGVVESAAQITLLSSADGDVTRERTRFDRLSRDEAGTRVELLTGYGSRRLVTTILRADEPEVAVPGRLVHRSVDDGSLVGVELTEGSQMQARDASTGEVLWEADRHTSGPVLVLRGRVYCTSGDSPGGLVAYDGRTGAPVWSASVGTYDQLARLMTDGRVLLVGLTPGDGSATGTLAAFALADGRALWHVPLPGGLHEVRAEAGLLVATSGGPTSVLTGTGPASGAVDP